MQSHPLRIRWGEEKRKFKTLPPHLSHQEEGTLWKRVSLGRECQNTPTYFIYKFWRNKTFLPHLFCVGHSEHVLGMLRWKPYHTAAHPRQRPCTVSSEY